VTGGIAAGGSAIVRPAEYYRHPAVRECIRQYCGGAGLRGLTCKRLTGLRPDVHLPSWEHAVAHPTSTLDELMAAGADIARSLWDTQHLLFHLDLDYHNIDAPAEPFTHPVETFFKLEPVYRAVRRVLGQFGINAFVLMTGRGYHFTGRIPLDDVVVDRLAALAPLTPPWHATLAMRQPDASPKELDERHARASFGIGLLVEYLAHLIMRRAARHAVIPTVFNGTDVGFGPSGRECVSLDFSYAAEFDVRVFAGMIATGLDRGVDYNCVSAQEKGLCPWAADCHHDLRDDHAHIFQRIAS
jgi:hypothetical protein